MYGLLIHIRKYEMYGTSVPQYKQKGIVRCFRTTNKMTFEEKTFKEQRPSFHVTYIYI